MIQPRDGAATVTTAVRDTTASGWLVASICLALMVGFLLGIALSSFLPVSAADLGTPVALLGQIPALAMLGAAALGLVTGAFAIVMSAFGAALAPTYALLLLAALVIWRARPPYT